MTAGTPGPDAEQAVPALVAQQIHPLDRLRVPDALMIVLRHELVVGPPEQVVCVPGLGTPLARGHGGPLLLHHQSDIVAQPGLDVPADRSGKHLGVAVQVGQRVRFQLGAFLRPSELLPHYDRGEAKQHGVEHADDRVDETRDVVVPREDLRPNDAADQQRAAYGDGGQHDYEE